MKTATRRIQSSSLHDTLARLSVQLDMLSVSFMADASKFFNSCESSWIWPNLTSLTLTSQLLRPSANPETLLQRGADIAMRMPKLKIMEIWNGRAGLAALFQYRSKPGLVTWKGTWDFTLRTATIKAWESVASYHRTKLSVVYEMLDKSKIGCLGDAIYHLDHSERVIRPVSLQQIRLECVYRNAHN